LQTCDDYELKITDNIMTISIEIINKLVSNTLNLCETDLSFSPHEADEKKILKYLKKLPSNSSARSRLLRHTHLSAFAFSNALRTLLEKEMVKTEVIKVFDKPMEVISLIKD
jgi:hypothetical protein